MKPETFRYWFKYPAVARDIISDMKLPFSWSPYDGDNPKYKEFAGRIVVVRKAPNKCESETVTMYQLNKFADITEWLDESKDEWVELTNRGVTS